MITFGQARRIVGTAVPGGAQTAPYGYESDSRWFPIMLPERLGGRVPGVSKATGAITWMSAISEEYSDARPYGTARP